MMSRVHVRRAREEATAAAPEMSQAARELLRELGGLLRTLTAASVRIGWLCLILLGGLFRFVLHSAFALRRRFRERPWAGEANATGSDG